MMLLCCLILMNIKGFFFGATQIKQDEEIHVVFTINKEMSLHIYGSVSTFERILSVCSLLLCFHPKPSFLNA